MAEKIKVKQSTIDEIKKMGMTKALASAKTRRSPEYQEALRRMYGERRVKEAMKGAQGGSAPRETYMKRGYSGAPTSSGTSAGPKKGGGQGYKSPSSNQKMDNRGKAALGVAGTIAAAGAGIYAKGKSVQRKVAKMTPAQQANYNKKATKRVADRTMKVAKSPAGKVAGKVFRKNPFVMAATTPVPKFGKAALKEKGKAAAKKVAKKAAQKKVQRPTGRGRGR
jgi:hypothetical protein